MTDSKSTKIYYYLDDLKTPYMSVVHVPSDRITLRDFKRVFVRRGYDFFCKKYDSQIKHEVKEQITSDSQKLQKSANGLIELFLLSQGTKAIDTSQDTNSSPEESNLFGDSNMRIPSDDESQTSTAFTSVSQQYNSNKRYDNATNKPYWSRDHRKRQKRSYSFLSTTFDDTEVSMALDLVTVTFNMDTNLPFGMSIVWRERKDFCGIFVHQITKNSVVALDGRIKVGYMILEVNNVSLDQFDMHNAIQFIKDNLRNAIESRGHLTMTCARSDYAEPNIFCLPPEPVRPIDPYVWAQHCNAMNSLNIIAEESEGGGGCVPSPLPTVVTNQPSNPLAVHNHVVSYGTDQRNGIITLPNHDASTAPLTAGKKNKRKKKNHKFCFGFI